MNAFNNLPAGPSEPKIFQMIKFIRKPIPLFEKCRETYGKTFTLKLPGHPPYVVISDPNDLKQVFMANQNQLNAGEINGTVLEPVLGSGSLLTLDGQKHFQHRKLMLPHFQGARMKVYEQSMAQIAQKRICNWKPGDKISLFDEARSITFSMILSTIFGMDERNIRFTTLEDVLNKLIHVIKKPFGLITLLNKSLHVNLGPLTPWAEIVKLRKKVDAYLFEEIESRRQMDLTSRIDILSLLLQVRDESGNPMSNKEIQDEMITLLIAGHETSTTGIAWAMYGILSDKHIYTKIKEELSFVVTDKNDLINNLDKLVYLDAIIKEALRITPVVPYIQRLTKEEFKIGEYIIPKGVVIVPSIYLAHRDPDVWKEPNKFIPERFLNSTEMPYSYLPFGGGMRRCIGGAFAQYEMKIVIAQMLLNAELSLKENYTPKLIRKGVVISPSDGVPVTVVRKIEQV